MMTIKIYKFRYKYMHLCGFLVCYCKYDIHINTYVPCMLQKPQNPAQGWPLRFLTWFLFFFQFFIVIRFPNLLLCEGFLM